MFKNIYTVKLSLAVHTKNITEAFKGPDSLPQKSIDESVKSFKKWLRCVKAASILWKRFVYERFVSIA